MANEMHYHLNLNSENSWPLTKMFVDETQRTFMDTFISKLLAVHLQCLSSWIII